MKDIVVKGKNAGRALWLLALCFVIACGINAGAIIAYHRPWTELFSQIGYTLCIAFGLWLFILLVWILVLIIKKLFKI